MEAAYSPININTIQRLIVKTEKKSKIFGSRKIKNNDSINKIIRKYKYKL
jgi:hypothetical protein